MRVCERGIGETEGGSSTQTHGLMDLRMNLYVFVALMYLGKRSSAELKQKALPLLERHVSS